MARGLKFRILEVEELYYLSSANKGADQLLSLFDVYASLLCHVMIKFVVLRKIFTLRCYLFPERLDIDEFKQQFLDRRTVSCICVCVSVCLCVYMCVYLSLFLCRSLCFSVSFGVYMSVRLIFCAFVCMFVRRKTSNFEAVLNWRHFMLLISHSGEV